MNADILKTEHYYRFLSADDLCDCAYCANYRNRIRSTYPEVAAYLSSLGVDIEKPLENSPLEPGENGMLEYCLCQYIVFGSCSKTYRHQIGDVAFRLAVSHPGTGISEEHFVLDLYPIRLKWPPVLETDATSLCYSGPILQ